MLVRDFINLAYKLKKDGGVSSLAIKFMAKHNISEDMDLSEQELILISQDLSNKDKRKEIINILLENMKSLTNEVCLKLNDLRNKTYKQISKIVHPDTQTGDTESFQILQEIKEFFWDYLGNPRKILMQIDWSAEKRVEGNNGLRGGFTNGL